MKKVIFLLALFLFTTANIFAQNTTPKKLATEVKSEKHLSSSILLWMRIDTPRKVGIDRWKGPHAKIIAANKGLYEYRQIHLSEQNPGLWSPINGVETVIPTNRKIDGIADVTLKNWASLLRGKKQNKLAYKDEVNIFKRTILYAAFPKYSRWYNLSGSNQKIEARSLVFIRKKGGVKDADFKKFIIEELSPVLANSGILKELRSKAYNAWKQKQWNSPNVLHDNVMSVQFQASLILGFTNKIEMKNFFNSQDVKDFSERISIFCSAIHAYEIDEILTFVKFGKQVTKFQKL